MVRSHVGDDDFTDIVAIVLQRDTGAQYFLIICLDYVLRAMIGLIKENDITLKIARS